MQEDHIDLEARWQRMQRLQQMKQEQKRRVAAEFHHYKTLLIGPHTDELSKERTYESFHYRAYGPPPSTDTDPDYWQITYPGLLNGVPADVPQFQLLDDDYWINAYTSIQKPDATMDDRRFLRKFIRASMSLIRQAASSSVRVGASDVIEVLRGDLGRNTLFHLVFCISRIVESTLDLQSFRACLKQRKPKANGTTIDAPGMSGDAPVNLDNSEKLTEWVHVRDPTMEGVPTAAYSDLDMPPNNSENLMEMDVPSELIRQLVLTTAMTSRDDEQISRLLDKICPILKEILANVGVALIPTDSPSGQSSIISVANGVSYLITDMKKEQDLLNEFVAGAWDDSSGSNTNWEKLVSTCCSKIRMLNEISQSEMYQSEMYRSVDFLNNAYSVAHVAFQMVINLFDPRRLWPDLSLPINELPEGALAGRASATGLKNAPKKWPENGYWRKLLRELEKERAL